VVDKVLILDTVLGPPAKKDLTDPLCPIKLQGQEGISIPYTYELTVIRHLDLKDFDPRILIGTVAKFGVLEKEDPETFIFRCGMIDRVEKVGKTSRFDRLMYKLHLVPPFQVLGRETRFRIFEHRTVVEILEEMLGEMKGAFPGSGRFPGMDFDLRNLDRDKFPRIEYSVQFGESTFGYLTRLMARFGISYWFDARDAKVPAPNGRAENEVMMLASADAVAAKMAGDPFGVKAGEPEVQKIGTPSQQFDVQMVRAVVGNFNILKPTEPIVAEQPIKPAFDLTRGGAISGSLVREEFPAPVDKDATPARGQDENHEAADYAEVLLVQDEARAFIFAGTSKSKRLIAGRAFTAELKKDDTNQSSGDQTFLMKLVLISGFENSYISTSAQDILEFFKNLGLGVLGISGDSAIDPSTTDVLIGLGGALKDDAKNAANDVLFPHSPSGEKMPYLSNFATAVAGAAIGALQNAIAQAKSANAGDFSAGFIAVTRQPNEGFLRPIPVSPPPIAHGPHLAVVIGPNGTDISDGTEIFADGLGRVRIRFPWDPGPRSGPGAGQPFGSDKATCWVRVAEGWAGQRMGTQFLPRIGDEVVVQFLNGDPEKPIVVGRLYNASSGPSSLPFFSPTNGSAPIDAKKLFEPQPSSLFERSGIKTRSVPRKDGAARFHMLRFDDTHGKEQLLIRSQGRFDDTSFHSRFETTNASRHVLVRSGKDADGKTIGGSAFTSVGGEADLAVGGDRYETMKSDYQYSVKGLQLVEAANIVTLVHNVWGLNGKTHHIEGSQKIEISVGSSSIIITPSSILIDAPMVKINSGGSAEPGAPQEITDAAGAEEADPGDPPDFLARRPPPKGGGSRKRTITPQHAVPVVALPNGTLQIGGKGSPVSVKPDSKDPNFADKAISDYDKYSKTPEGEKALQEMKANGSAATIERADPSNGSVHVQSSPTTKQSTIKYNPDDFAATNDPDSQSSDKALGDAINTANEQTKPPGPSTPAP
jgi:uncharacterized protein involved in type VI secretion and phage assembly